MNVMIIDNALNAYIAESYDYTRLGCIRKCFPWNRVTFDRINQDNGIFSPVVLIGQNIHQSGRKHVTVSADDSFVRASTFAQVHSDWTVRI